MLGRILTFMVLFLFDFNATPIAIQFAPLVIFSVILLFILLIFYLLAMLLHKSLSLKLRLLFRFDVALLRLLFDGRLSRWRES